MTLAGKVIIVTGATGNVGQAVCKALAQAGACLALVDRDMQKLRDLSQELGEQEGCYQGFVADLSDPDGVAQLMTQVAGQFPHVHGLVHTVGGYAAGDPVHSGNLDVWDKMMALNARATYITAGRVAKYMVEQNTPGSIALVLARAGEKGSKGNAAYAASKAAAARIMESMALELKDHHIRVNGVSPSIIDTPPNREAMPGADFEKWVKPAEIGDLMVFLMSDASSAMTGANIDFNGRL